MQHGMDSSPQRVRTASDSLKTPRCVGMEMKAVVFNSFGGLLRMTEVTDPEVHDDDVSFHSEKGRQRAAAMVGTEWGVWMPRVAVEAEAVMANRDRARIVHGGALSGVSGHG